MDLGVMDMTCGRISHLLMATLYLSILVWLSDTVCTSRFQTKPMYRVELVKGWSFDFSQGIPNSSEILSMSARQYV